MRFISIDPGTVTIGVAYWEIDDDFNIVNIDSETVYIDNSLHMEKRLDRINRIFLSIFDDFKPYQLAHESAFMSRLHPQAYGPIYTSIFLIRNAYIYLYGREGMFTYPPKYVKSIMTKGTADKDDMFKAVESNDELSKFLIGNESEHVIDAMSIGYAHLLNMRELPEILFI